MKRFFLLFIVLCTCFAQIPPPKDQKRDEDDPKLPNGRSQREEILKTDHRKNIEEAAELAKLAEEVKADLENGDRNVVSVKMIKQTEEIEKLAKSIRGRLKRY